MFYSCQMKKKKFNQSEVKSILLSIFGRYVQAKCLMANSKPFIFIGINLPNLLKHPLSTCYEDKTSCIFICENHA